uniref:Uncharacterized protein LOC104224943 n=1 Tax=Nicotiana sylvestris TaxID=4096 RepID=A0A1U7W8M6_NICSY|nr:PREDICTED: uncharacterized protein LOC104224943 [Nicotiana sylvestris]
MAIKLVGRDCTLNVVSAYAPHVVLDDEVKPRFWERERNGGGTSLLDFAKAFRLVIANSSFSKREEHLVTFQNAVAKTQINYLLLRKCDRGMCKDFKVIPGEIFAMQHRLLVMDIGIMLKRRKRSVRE